MKGATYKPIAEAWAVWNEDQCGRALKSKGKVRFCRGDFYSYTTVIARYLTINEKQMVLATSGYYSMTTSRHLGIALRHVGNVPIFRVPHLTIHSSDTHVENAQYLWRKVCDFRDQAVREWKKANDYYSADNNWPFHLRELWENCNKYIEMTGVQFAVPITPLDELMTMIRTTREMKRAEFNLPANVRRRERAAARREAVNALNL